MYTEGLVCFKHCVWLLLPSAFGFGASLCADRRRLQRLMRSGGGGSEVCAGQTHNLWVQLLAGLTFGGTLQYETCHLSSPPRPSKLWLKRFRGVALPAACQRSSASSCAAFIGCFSRPWSALKNQASLHRCFLNFIFCGIFTPLFSYFSTISLCWSLPPLPCQHHHSLGNLSVFSSPFTTSCLHGIFSF